jgi:hypothetical protein
VTDKWYKLDKNESEYSPRGGIDIWCLCLNADKLANDAKEKAKADNPSYDSDIYDIIIVVDPTSFYDNRFGWKTIFGDDIAGITTSSRNIVVGTYYVLTENQKIGMVKTIAHEITHWYDQLKNSILGSLGMKIIDNPILGPHGDNHDSGYCIMGPYSSMEGYESPFCPVCGKKMGFLNYSDINVSSTISTKELLPIEDSNNRSFHFKKDKWKVRVIPIPPYIQLYLETTHYFLEFRKGSWPYDYELTRLGARPYVLVWKGVDDDISILAPNWDHPEVPFPFGILYSVSQTYNDQDTGLRLILDSISDTSASIRANYATDVFTTATKISNTSYQINMSIIGNFFENTTFQFRVLDNVDQNVIHMLNLTSDANGTFNQTISFKDNVTDSIENHPYTLQLFNGVGWSTLHTVYPTLVDGVIDRKPLFSTEDSEEIGTAGDIKKLGASPGSIKISLETASPVNTSAYTYAIYMDIDNSTDTGEVINGIGADYKIEYSSIGTNLFKYGNLSTNQTVHNIIESPHPYPNNYDNTWIITQPDATQIRAHFVNISTESNYDYIYIYDSNDSLVASYDGIYNDIWTSWVPGNTLKIRLITDGSITYYGFYSDKYEYTSYQNETWKNVSTSYVLGASNDSTIELLTSTEIIGKPDIVKLIARTYDQTSLLIDEAPDGTANQTYILFADVRPTDIRFSKASYDQNENVTVSGYGFNPNEPINLTLKNSTGDILWEGPVQSDSNGLVNATVWTVPNDFEGTVNLYWAGVYADSFSVVVNRVPSIGISSDINAPSEVLTGETFNVTVPITNIGDLDVSNITVSTTIVNLSGFLEPQQVGSLSSGKNTTLSWTITAVNPGIGKVMVNITSPFIQNITLQKVIVVNKFNLTIETDNTTYKPGDIVSITTHVKNENPEVAYANMYVNVTVKRGLFNDTTTIPIASLLALETLSSTLGWDSAGIDNGTYTIIARLFKGEEELANASKSVKIGINEVYTSPLITFIANERKTIDASVADTILEIVTLQNITGLINITESESNLSGTNALSVPKLGKYVKIDANDDLKNSLAWAIIKISYTDAELAATGLKESSLSIYWWNESSSEWVKLSKGTPYWVNDAGVNTTDNLVWVNVSHFSYYSVGGETYTPQPTPTAGGGGGGGAVEVIAKPFNELTKDLLEKVFKAKNLVTKKFVEIPKQALASLLSIVEKTYSYPFFEELEDIIKTKPERLEGDIYEITAQQVLSRYTWAPRIIVARGDLEVDSYAALALARERGALILLTKPEELPEATLNAIEKLRPNEIIIVGGSVAVSKEVEEELRKRAKVKRIWGTTRIETSVEIAKQFAKPKYLVIASCNSSEKAAYIAYLYRAPVLYVKDDLPSVVEDYLKEKLREYPKPRIIFIEVNERVREEIEKIK